MTVSKIPWKRVLRKFVVSAHFVHKQVKIFLHVLCICEKLQWNGRWIQSKGNVLYFSFRVFINHSVRKAVIPAFFLKTFHFFLRNLVVAYMRQTGRHFERKVLVYESLKPEKQKTPFNFQRLKCIWHEKFFLLIWKAFWNTEEWRFSFWNIFFHFRDIDIFLLCKLVQWWRHLVCN